ncbi:MAG TPA: restriction endonuclease [Nitrososphaera sp.]
MDQKVTTLKEFQSLARITSISVAKVVLDFLIAQGIGQIVGGNLVFSASDRLKAAILSLHGGCDARLVSEQLSWRDFEGLASEILTSFGYKTTTNMRLTKPRMEIDVVGISSGMAVLVDCKHWKRSNGSLISAFAKKQEARAFRLVREDPRIVNAVPVILTLNTESVRFVERVPIVPVIQFKSFLADLQSHLSEIRVI